MTMTERLKLATKARLEAGETITDIPLTSETKRELGIDEEGENFAGRQEEKRKEFSGKRGSIEVSIGGYDEFELLRTLNPADIKTVLLVLMHLFNQGDLHRIEKLGVPAGKSDVIKKKAQEFAELVSEIVQSE